MEESLVAGVVGQEISSVLRACREHIPRETFLAGGRITSAFLIRCSRKRVAASKNIRELCWTLALWYGRVDATARGS